MEAGKRKISDIIKQTRVLEVPFYQRSYVWYEDQWSRMIEDAEMITMLDRDYFIGSIILKQRPTASNIHEKRVIIDGQQRLTTLTILFKVLALKSNMLGKFDNRFRLEEDENGVRKSVILHSHRDRSAFEQIIELSDASVLSEDADTSKLTKCFNFFMKNVDPSKISFDAVYNRMLFVGIDLGKDEDEQQIFDTINSLGVKLSTSELLKNHLFSEEDLKQYNEYWYDVFEADDVHSYWQQEVTAGSYKRQLVDMFLYSLLQIKIHDKAYDVDTKDKLLFAKMDRLFESYKYFMDKYSVDRDELVKEIKDYAELFREYIDPDAVNQPLEKDNQISRINNVIFGLASTVLITYVLFAAYKNRGNKESFDDLMKSVEAYILRRIIVKASNRGYTSLFSESLILQNAYTSDAFVEYVSERGDVSLFMPSDLQLEDGIKNSKLTNYNARGVLYLIESAIRDENKNSNGLLSIYRYSLEHIMPKKWINNWERLDDEDLIRQRNDKLLTLGNLTIITQTLNTSIRDASWKLKLHGDDKRGGLIKYSSGIETFVDCITIDQWDENKIDDRGIFLANHAKEVWPIP